MGAKNESFFKVPLVLVGMFPFWFSFGRMVAILKHGVVIDWYFFVFTQFVDLVPRYVLVILASSSSSCFFGGCLVTCVVFLMFCCLSTDVPQTSLLSTQTHHIVLLKMESRLHPNIIHGDATYHSKTLTRPNPVAKPTGFSFENNKLGQGPEHTNLPEHRCGHCKKMKPEACRLECRLDGSFAARGSTSPFLLKSISVGVFV